MPEGRSVRVVTLGCRLNAYESEVMRGHAEEAGLCDTVIVNTCAVTAEAVRDAARRWLDKQRSVTGYLIKDTRAEEKRS